MEEVEHYLPSGQGLVLEHGSASLLSIRPCREVEWCKNRDHLLLFGLEACVRLLI